MNDAWIDRAVKPGYSFWHFSIGGWLKTRDDEDLGTINAAAIRREIKLFYIISLSPKLIEFGGWKGRVWSLKRVSLLP